MKQKNHWILDYCVEINGNCTGSFSWKDWPVIKVLEAFLDETEKSLGIRSQ